VVEGQTGLVAATISPISVRAGMEALKQGGTAADAAATVALTQIMVALGSYVSYAGIMELLYYDAKSGEVYAMDAGWNSYRGETDPGSIPVSDMGPMDARRPTEGPEGRKTMVPGFMAGLEAMHKRFGRLPFADLCQPALWYAEKGVVITPSLAGYFRMREKYLSRTAEGRDFMHQAGDHLPQPGDRFVQTAAASTLRAIAENGAQTMYSGEWARQYVEAVRREGGKVTLGDMQRYQRTWDKPPKTVFAGHTVFGAANEGGTQVLEALNLAEELKIDRMGPYWKDGKALQGISRALQLVQAETFAPPAITEYWRAHGISSSPDDRITKAYAHAMAPMLADAPAGEQKPDAPNHSDSIVVVDRWGNVAAMVHSLNSVVWGTTGIVVGGIPVSDPAGSLQRRLVDRKPGDRVENAMSVAMAMTGAKPTLAVAAIGSSLIQETVRVVVGVLENHADSQALMAAPPLLMNMQRAGPGEGPASRALVVPAGAYDAEFLKSLQASGIGVQELPWQRALSLKGTAVMATIDPQSGKRGSVETPTVFGFADAY
jgi:gamma-glutamyltranspeptidase/glutathione hydrolase